MVDRNERRALVWQMVQDIKMKKGCTYCGFNDHPHALHFDHLSDKKANVSDLIRSDYSIATILREIDKCQVLCANCHAVVTHARKTDPSGS